MNQAMREKDKARKEALRMLPAAIQRREVDERIELDDSKVLAEVEKLDKPGRDSISQFEQGGRDDLADKERQDVAVLTEYLPEQLSDEEVASHIRQAIEKTGAASMKDMGKVMGMLKPALQGRADMGAVSGKIKALLQG